jgi:hypothetical protein
VVNIDMSTRGINASFQGFVDRMLFSVPRLFADGLTLGVVIPQSAWAYRLTVVTTIVTIEGATINI